MSEEAFRSAEEIMHFYGACEGHPECKRCEDPIEKALRLFHEALNAVFGKTFPVPVPDPVHQGSD